MFDAETVFWASAILLAYTYGGYPLLIRAMSLAWPNSFRKDRIVPTVSVIVVAHDEAARIRSKIENLLALDYPQDRIEIIIASDGSTDATVPLARETHDPRLVVREFRQRRGKTAVLDELVPAVRGSIVVLTDVRQKIERHALHEITAPFADPRVGVVGGELLLAEGRKGSEVAEGAGAYWRYERFIRHCESTLDSTVGVSGAFYALRREAFRPVATDIVLDDVAIPMAISRQGYRVVLEPRARAFDEIVATADAEFNRKVRTIAGNFQLFRREPWLLVPFVNRLWFQTVSHKLLRLLSPLALLAVFVSNGFLVHASPYRFLLGLQVMFYIAALVGRVTRHRQGVFRWFGVPYAFCLLNYATFVAMLRIVTHGQQVTWQRTHHDPGST